MNINELYELAKLASQGEWVCSGFIVSAKDSGYVPIADTELDNESMSENAAYIADANPSAIIELIAAYREAVAALNEALPGCIGYAEYWSGKGADKADKSCMQVREALDTAKRLGVE